MLRLSQDCRPFGGSYNTDNSKIRGSHRSQKAGTNSYRHGIRRVQRRAGDEQRMYSRPSDVGQVEVGVGKVNARG